MTIALLSYEHPTNGHRGGIGTYIQTISKILRAAGHTVITFISTNKSEAFWQDDKTYCIPATNGDDFDKKLPKYFAPIHDQYKFDVVEGTDFKACGLAIKKTFPKLPLVVKLHTPLYIVDHLLHTPLTFWAKIRFIVGGLIRFRIAAIPGAINRQDYQQEFEIIKLADRISSPSLSIKNLMNRYRFNIGDNVDIVPLPITSLNDDDTIVVTNAPRKNITSDAHVLFIGRMETRKGVIDLADAIPLILKKYPGTKFTFAGKAALSPQKGVDMISFLKKKLAKHLQAITFTDELDHADLAGYLSKADICIFPSHYESFGLACCEAMYAGKAVIGSAAGGMAEIMEDNISGLLIEPASPQIIADKIAYLIANNDVRINLGKNAHKRIREHYCAGAVLPLQIKNYNKAIKAAQCI